MAGQRLVESPVRTLMGNLALGPRLQDDVDHFLPEGSPVLEADLPGFELARTCPETDPELEAAA